MIRDQHGPIFHPGDEDTEYDFEDVDCEDCGRKFYIRPSLYTKEAQERRRQQGLPERPWPTRCDGCAKAFKEFSKFIEQSEDRLKRS